MKFDNKAIAEAAYYIWQNNGCPTNSHSSDWATAMNQLSAMNAVKTASHKLAAAKSSAAKAIVIKAACLKSAGSKAPASKINTIATKKTTKKSK